MADSMGSGLDEDVKEKEFFWPSHLGGRVFSARSRLGGWTVQPLSHSEPHCRTCPH